MNPTCSTCGSSTTRRTRRKNTIVHRLRRFFGYYPWECLTCQARFFSQQRYSKGERSPHGEVYVGEKKKNAPNADPARQDKN